MNKGESSFLSSEILLLLGSDISHQSPAGIVL